MKTLRFASRPMLLAMASELAYESKIDVIARINMWGFEESYFFDQNGTQAFLAFDDHDVVLAFRGTEIKSFKDWKADFKFTKVAGPFGGRVHAGFSHALDAVWLSVNYRIRMIPGLHKRRLWITGHSLGGGLATIACARLIEAGIVPRALVVYGCPRVGNRKFAKNLNKRMPGRVLRFENNNDVVVRIPPRWWFYRHTGARMYISTNGEVVREPSSWFVFKDRLRGRWRDFGRLGTDGLKDHRVPKYVEALQESLVEIA